MSQNINFKSVFKVIFTWFLFIPVAIMNGVVRNSFYQQFVGELTAHQLSTVSGSAAFVGLVYVILRKEIKEWGLSKLVGVGLLWVGMTVCFEFLFGHFVVGHSWEKLLADYNIWEGRVWSLFLVVSFLSPWLVKKLVSRKEK